MQDKNNDTNFIRLSDTFESVNSVVMLKVQKVASVDVISLLFMVRVNTEVAAWKSVSRWKRKQNGDMPVSLHLARKTWITKFVENT